MKTSMPEVELSCDNLSSTHRRRAVVLNDGTMYLSRLKEEDRGVYVCQKYGNTLKEVTLVMAGTPID